MMSVVPSADPSIEIVTPSYAPDLELCRDLVESVAAFARTPVRHRIIVPARDADAFAGLASDSVRIERVPDVLPRGLVAVPRANVWLNTRAPWSPVRGWIAQQIVKLAASAGSAADVVLLVDSDVVFVRPFDASTYLVDGEVPLYRLPGAVDARLPRHVAWDAVARRLLGLPASDAATHPDYICWPCLWRPDVVRRLCAHLERTTGRPWWSAIARELHFSEMVLYGVFTDHHETVAAPATDDMHCVTHSDETALTSRDLDVFLDGVGRDDVAVMVSAKSGTELADRRRALRRFA